MTEDEKKILARARAKAYRLANPERAKAAIDKCKAAKPEKYAKLRADWFEKNSDANKKKWKEYRSKNKEMVAAAITDWVARHPTRRREIANNWRKRNPEKVNAVYANRRAAKKQAAPKWANKFFISEAYDLAKRRSKSFGFKWHVDHIVPLTSPIVCGLHVEHNLQVIPGSINQSKNNRHWPDMP